MNSTDKYYDLVDGVKFASTGTYYGKSTDTKPQNAGNGSVFIEMDTGKLYFYDAEGAEWFEWGKQASS